MFYQGTILSERIIAEYQFQLDSGWKRGLS